MGLARRLIALAPGTRQWRCQCVHIFWVDAVLALLFKNSSALSTAVIYLLTLLFCLQQTTTVLLLMMFYFGMRTRNIFLYCRLHIGLHWWIAVTAHVSLCVTASSHVHRWVMSCLEVLGDCLSCSPANNCQHWHQAVNQPAGNTIYNNSSPPLQSFTPCLVSYPREFSTEGLKKNNDNNTICIAP